MQIIINKYLVLLLPLLLLIGCQNTPHNSKITPASPEAVLIEYLHANFEAGWFNHSKKSYALLAKQDRQYKSLKEYLSGNKKLIPELRSFLTQNSRIEFIETTKSQQKTTLKYKITSPIYNEFSNYITHWLSGDSEKQKELLKEFQSLPKDQYKSSIETQDLVFEDGSWKIFIDYVTLKKIDALNDQADKLIPQVYLCEFKHADHLFRDFDKLLKVKSIYQKILETDPDNSISSRLKTIDNCIAKGVIYDKNRNYVVANNVRVSETQNSNMTISGELANYSNLAFSEVGITVHYLDKYGTTIHIKKYTPIYSSSPEVNRLPPGYKYEFWYVETDIPNNWNHQIKVYVTNLEI